jgi:hypothetical protein
MTKRLIDIKQPRARKEYTCNKCGTIISKGEIYSYKIFISSDNKSFSPERYHLNCPSKLEILFMNILACWKKLF